MNKKEMPSADQIKNSIVDRQVKGSARKYTRDIEQKIYSEYDKKKITEKEAKNDPNLEIWNACGDFIEMMDADIELKKIFLDKKPSDFVEDELLYDNRVEGEEEYVVEFKVNQECEEQRELQDWIWRNAKYFPYKLEVQ